jgi:hypothetical protein
MWPFLFGAVHFTVARARDAGACHTDLQQSKDRGLGMRINREHDGRGGAAWH